MKPSSLNEIKQEITSLDKKELVDLLLRLSKYKKDNKELLTYLLFSAHDENEYINNVKTEIENQFKIMNKSNIYFAKKSIRKALRIANKYIKYSGKKETEAELLIHFCRLLNGSDVKYQSSVAMNNLYNRQIDRIKKAISTMHEDLQYDYIKEINKLEENTIKEKNVLLKLLRK